MRGESPRREEAWLLVPGGNCVAARRSGEQPEGNDPSATQVNSIRPVTSTSLLLNGEVQNTPTTSREGWWEGSRPRGKATEAKPEQRQWGVRGGWRQKDRKTRHLNRETCPQAGSAAGVRAPIVARKRSNSRGAKGCRKMESTNLGKLNNNHRRVPEG